MKAQRTWQEYRAIDLTIWAVLLAIFEYLIVRAATWWFPGELYTVSLAGPLSAIVYMRWGPWGLIHAAEAGLVSCFFAGASGRQYMIYIIGNCLSGLSVFLLKAVGKEKVRKSGVGLLYPLLVLALMHTGRAAVALLTGAGWGEALGFFTTDSLSYIFTFVIIWIARKLDGVYEDQKHYLLRIHSEEEEKGGKL